MARKQYFLACPLGWETMFPNLSSLVVKLIFPPQQVKSLMAALLIGHLGLSAAVIVASGLYGHVNDTVPIPRPLMVAQTVMVRDFN